MGRHAENPEAVKARGGRTSKSNKKGVEIPASFPKMPSNLSKAAKKYWNMYCELYTTTTILTCFDGAMLAMLCDDMAERDRYIEERNNLIDLGLGTIYETSNCAFAVHPCVKMIERLNSDIARNCRVLGLDPLNRSSIKPAEGGPKTSSRPSMKKRK